MKIEIILRKELDGGCPVIFYRDIDKRIPKAPLTCFDGCHSESCLDYYYQGTKPATKRECSYLLSIFKRYLEKGETLQMYKKLKW